MHTVELERPHVNITACGGHDLPAGRDAIFCPVAEVRKGFTKGVDIIHNG